MARILVAHASKNGSTTEISEAVAATLRELGHDVDVRVAHDVRSLDGFDAVLFGGALYYFKLVGEGRRFLARFARHLGSLPVAAFGCGPIEDTEEHWSGARQHFESAVAAHPGLAPAAVAVFGGAFDAKSARFPESMMMKTFPTTDLRDWQAIESWARSLPDALGLADGARLDASS